MSKIYHWKLGKNYSFGYADYVITENDFCSGIRYAITKKYSLLFLEEKNIFSKTNPKASLGTMWKMLLSDNEKYQHPEIVWVKPDWVQPMKNQ